jgi:glutamyl-tRNA synthetase
LHLGGALIALASRVLGDVLVLRMEDLDPPRVVPGAAERILEDLRWLGIRWEEGPDAGGLHGPYVQSSRGPIYEAAIAVLAARDLVYPCDCSRQEIASSAPHVGEEIVYPGTCRDRDPRRAFKRPFALRFRAPVDPIAWNDLVRGEMSMSPAVAGDFVLRRGDGLYAYQLAAAVDDWAMNVTHVLRGDDLVSSTPRQIAILRALGADRVPLYGHLPLVRAADGSRLAKRTPGASISDLRARGVGPEAILGVLGHALGLREDDGPCTIGELRRSEDFLRRAVPLRIPARFSS